MRGAALPRKGCSRRESIKFRERKRQRRGKFGKFGAAEESTFGSNISTLVTSTREGARGTDRACSNPSPPAAAGA
jgi:hypothetical protein